MAQAPDIRPVNEIINACLRVYQYGDRNLLEYYNDLRQDTIVEDSLYDFLIKKVINPPTQRGNFYNLEHYLKTLIQLCLRFFVTQPLDNGPMINYLDMLYNHKEDLIIIELGIAWINESIYKSIVGPQHGDPSNHQINCALLLEELYSVCTDRVAINSPRMGNTISLAGEMIEITTSLKSYTRKIRDGNYPRIVTNRQTHHPILHNGVPLQIMACYYIIAMTDEGRITFNDGSWIHLRSGSAPPALAAPPAPAAPAPSAKGATMRASAIEWLTQHREGRRTWAEAWAARPRMLTVDWDIFRDRINAMLRQINEFREELALGAQGLDVIIPEMEHEVRSCRSWVEAIQTRPTRPTQQRRVWRGRPHAGREFKSKYLKYKMKYLKLKAKLNLSS